ncbi:hypothetical protein [Microbacterium sp. No. 7]|uniref:hypothetical protein n=1 Tax=Microbacterium sp. No. 7 TaxID=1714373 RepID=UPI0006D257AC|nr:hypothetical protein [Microbacterium sp. No. 7]
MIRTHAVPRPLRTGAALVSVAGIVLVAAGCAQTADEAIADGDATTQAPSAAVTETDEATTETETAEPTGEAASSGSIYTDGTYSAEGSYATPETVETVSVTITLEGDVVTAVEVVGDPQTRESVQYQSQFIGGISDAVVGQRIDELSVSRVAGSSLTSGGFNAALETIKSEAAA